MAADGKDRGGKGLDRRSLLAGAGIGAAGAGLAAAGLSAVKDAAAPILPRAPVRAGEAARIATDYRHSNPAFEAKAAAEKGAPNIVVIVLDDVGFSDLGCYGGDIETPNIDALAGRGLRYSNFRTTAMCSCTRASLLTGLNHHSAGMGWLADIDSGYPGYRGDLTLEAETLPEVLQGAGWATFLVGKWHVNYVGTNGPAGPFHNWPTHRGFEHAYWFQGHSSDYWRPGALFDGVTPVDPPLKPDYYLTDDLTDRAIDYVRTSKMLEPDKPFYLQLAYSGAHSPLHARPEDRDHYRGRFDDGWDAARARRLARQKAMGVVDSDCALPDLSFGASPWASLPPKTRRLFARYQEVYAGVVAGLDRNIGRLVAELEAMGVRENTLIVLMSDNGGSAEGSPDGALNVIGEVVGDAASEDEALAHFDHMGERGTFPHYPMGWACASNTPYRLYKQYTALGGVADPLILSWPKRIKAGGQVRRNFVHVIDLYPTLLEAAGVERPPTYRGAPQKPVEGRSVLATFDDPAAATRTEQYYELGGFRAYEEGTWRLVAQHQRGEDFAKDHWALYDRSVDPAEITDVSDKHPEVAERLKAKWDAAAKAHNVYPLDDRNLVLKLMQTRMKDTRKSWDIRPPMRTLPADVAPSVFGVDHQIEVTFERPAGVEAGVLVSCGSYPGGFSLYLKGGRLYYEISVLPRREVLDAGPVPQGKVVVRYQQVMKVRPFDGKGILSVNGEKRVEHVFRKALVGPAYDGFAIGSDPGEQVSDAYVGANPYPAKIERVKIEIDMRPPNPAELVSFMQKLKMRA